MTSRTQPAQVREEHAIEKLETGGAEAGYVRAAGDQIAANRTTQTIAGITRIVWIRSVVDPAVPMSISITGGPPIPEARADRLLQL